MGIFKNKEDKEFEMAHEGFKVFAELGKTLNIPSLRLGLKVSEINRKMQDISLKIIDKKDFRNEDKKAKEYLAIIEQFNKILDDFEEEI